jgi:hypothetical protein
LERYRQVENEVRPGKNNEILHKINSDLSVLYGIYMIWCEGSRDESILGIRN